VRLALRLRLQGRIENRLDAVRTIPRFASASGSDFPQALQPLCHETLSPQPDCLAIDLQCGCNSRFRFPTGHGQHNAASQRDLLRCAHRCQPLPDLILLILRKRKRRRRTRHTSLSDPPELYVQLFVGHYTSEIVFEGADRGTPKEKPIPPEPVSYARSLLRAKALSPEVLVAYKMNGQDLPQDHGYPVRLIVPGHYGMASVKWLTRIHAMRETFQGYWQTSDYAYWHQFDGKPVRLPLSEMAVKSQIARPSTYEVVPGGRPYRIFGACWCGDAEVKEVEASTDGGASWALAEFLDAPLRFAWRRFQLTWQVPEQSGRYELMARAKDSNGQQQPEQHDANFGTYVIHHPLAIEVFVDAPKADSGSSPAL
jgi:hypothetical protein